MADADSPFAMLRDGAARALEEYVDDTAAVRETLTALRDGYCSELASQAALAAALEAEENGEVRATPCPCHARTWHANPA